MFTGIIESTAKILKKSSFGLTLERPRSFDDVKIGCSIAVSGACLSVTSFDETSMSFDVIETTWKKTKLGLLKEGDSVNLERALRVDGRLEGHVVLGHIEGTGAVVSISHGPDPRLTVDVPRELLPYVVLHGSVTIDGVALTISDLKVSHVSVSLIPHTLKVTTLHALKKGDLVNLESDILGKYVLQSHVSR